MSVARIPIDGLWRCLCPSFDRVSLASTARVGTQLRNDGSGFRVSSNREFHAGRARRWPAHAIGGSVVSGEVEGGRSAVGTESAADQSREDESRRSPEVNKAATPPDHTRIVRKIPSQGVPVSIVAAQQQWMLRLAREATLGRLPPRQRHTPRLSHGWENVVMRKVRIGSDTTGDGEKGNSSSEKSREKVNSKLGYAQERWLQRQVEKGKRALHGSGTQEIVGRDNGGLNMESRPDDIENTGNDESDSKIPQTMAAFSGASHIPIRQNEGGLISQAIGDEGSKGDGEINYLPLTSPHGMEEAIVSFSQAYAQDIRQSKAEPELSTTSTSSLNWDDRPSNEHLHIRQPIDSLKTTSAASNVQGLAEPSPESKMEPGSRESLSDFTSSKGENFINSAEVENGSSKTTETPKHEDDTPIFSERQDWNDLLQDTPVSAREEVEIVKSALPVGPSQIVDSTSPVWNTIPSRESPGSPPQVVLEDDEVQNTESPGLTLFGHLTSDLPAVLDGDAALQKLDPSFHDPPPENPLWDKIPIVHLHARLRSLTTAKNAYSEICELVTYLIRNRGEQPCLMHYDALIRANADAERGSVDVVNRLLEEMKGMGVGADSGLYHGVLQVLAIHPDYLLRDQILQEMKIRWFGLSPEGWHNYVIGLIRDRQYEVAMDKLEQMQSDSVVVQPWLYDIFMFQLCDAGELDEVLKLLKYRFEHDRGTIETSIWYYILDAFTKGYHYEGTTFIWKKRISTNQIVPSDGICTAMLNMAARYADSERATAAVRILSTRLPVLGMHHYEALLTAYTSSGDTKTAFRIMAIMSKAQMHPDINTTRPIFIYISQSIQLCRVAWVDLKGLSEDGHVIPVAAANVILEATSEVGYFDEAVALYKELHEVIETGPDVETFNTLLQGAVYAGRKDLCMFLASEMAALDLKPNELTYDRLILACLGEEDYEDAFRYLEEMIEVGADKGDGGWWMRKGTALTLAQRCATAADNRAWGIYNQMLERGMDVKERWIANKWKTEEIG